MFTYNVHLSLYADIKIEASPNLNPATRDADWSGPADGNTVNFGAGVSYVDVMFNILPDDEVEDTECFEVSLDPAYAVGATVDSIQHDEPLKTTVCIVDETSK